MHKEGIIVNVRAYYAPLLSAHIHCFALAAICPQSTAAHGILIRSGDSPGSAPSRP